MKFKKLYLCVTLLMIGIIISNSNHLDFTSDSKSNQEVRTVSYNEKSIDEETLFDGFDDHTVDENEEGFKIEAKKKYDVSLLSDLNLVDLGINDEAITVKYNVDYVENENAIILSITIDNNDEIIVDQLPGLITVNEGGETDVLFVYEDDNMWLSDLIADDYISNEGLFSWLKKVTSKVANVVSDTFKVIGNSIATFFLNGLELVKDVVTLNFSKAAANFGAMFLNMYEEVDSKGNKTGVFHAAFDCWQQCFGYCDFFDKVFDAFTCMDRKKFMFDMDGDNYDEHILWAWKGDYLNLGAGAELGLYKRWKYDSNYWVVDKSEAIKMTVKLTKNNNIIFDYQPTQKQWWITGFNYAYHTTQYELDSDITKAYYTITFNDYSSYQSFYRANSNYVSDEKWTHNGGYKFSYAF